MSAENLTYFKFLSNIISRGIWAKLSSGARTLYPVLLSFSDRNFKPVWPGTKKLLELTGFKHKESISKARRELADAGLLTFSIGTGRKNTVYQFSIPHPEVCYNMPLGAVGLGGLVSAEGSPGVRGDSPPYNQIHISIDNYPNMLNSKVKNNYTKSGRSEKSNITNLNEEADLKHIKKDLPAFTFSTWKELKKELSNTVSPSSLNLICQAFLMQKDNNYIFRDNLPEYLKTHLRRICNVFFEAQETPNYKTYQGRFVKVE